MHAFVASHLATDAGLPPPKFKLVPGMDSAAALPAQARPVSHSAALATDYPACGSVFVLDLCERITALVRLKASTFRRPFSTAHHGLLQQTLHMPIDSIPGCGSLHPSQDDWLRMHAHVVWCACQCKACVSTRSSYCARCVKREALQSK